MKTFLLLLVIVVAVGFYLWHDRIMNVSVAEPEVRALHLAPPGTFFLVEYVSARTANGVVGFSPGQKVQFVSADKEKGTLLVTDGEHQVAVKPGQLTNDEDVAALAANQDQQSQAQVAAALDKERKQAAKVDQQTYVKTAKDLDKARANPASGVGRTALDQPAKPNTGNPYSYLNR